MSDGSNIIRLDTSGFLRGVADQLDAELPGRIRSALVVVTSDQGELRVMSSNGDPAEGISILAGAIDVWARSAIHHAQQENADGDDGGPPEAA